MSTIQPIASLQDVAMEPWAHPSERALVERARRGDHDAFAALVDNRLPATFRTVLAILGNESDARDATQTIFVQAWRNLPSLRDPELFAAWFGRIVVNTARTSLRRRGRQRVREIAFAGLPDEGGSLQARTAAHEDQTASNDRLERAFERLSDGERACLWLHHYEGLSLAEMGLRLHVSPKTIKSRLFTARRALERALEAEDRQR